ncbi:MAG TPA: hypothetical protein VNB06_18670 [Thermoanaerobaculia bacterium]|nr:hypothetical protein [Thermoanaerobaculia bacterium]
MDTSVIAPLQPRLVISCGLIALRHQTTSKGPGHDDTAESEHGFGPSGEIKVVGKSGQISLGKRYAGRTLELQRLEDGSILLLAVAVVPESQLWTVEEPDRSPPIATGTSCASPLFTLTTNSAYRR